MTLLDIFEAFCGTYFEVFDKRVDLNKQAGLANFFICYIKKLCGFSSLCYMNNSKQIGKLLQNYGHFWS